MGVRVPNFVPEGLTGPARDCRLKTEAPIGESHVGPKNSVLAATGFTRQAVDIRLAGGSLDHRRPGNRRELTTIRRAG